MTNENNKIGTGSIMENFSLISYDEDSGRMLMRKEFDDGSVWLEPVAFSIPDLFYLFKEEGVNPMEMKDETCFEFHKAKVEIGEMTTTYDVDEDMCSDACYYVCRASRTKERGDEFV